MNLEQIYTGCLAQGAYYISHNGEAAIIDPLREVGPYIDRAAKRGDTIKYIFETHFHADFVSGHLDLARKTGAPIIYGPKADPEFRAHIATDGEEFKIGGLTIRVMHTPGHTMESTCYLLLKEDGTPHCVFTGDTLFIGDVGRPDLAQKMGELTKEDLAGFLYDSLNSKIKPLPDDVIVYPAHGAGSACGKNMSKETFDTLGHQKQVNYALLAPTKEQFVKEVTEGIAPPPAYFPMNVALNKGGVASLDTVLERGLKALTPDDLELIVESTGALVLDTRAPQTFKDGFIPKSINIGLKGDFAPWVGTLITDIAQPIILVCDEGKEQEAVTRLSRVGYDNTLGYLKGGIAAWKSAGKDIDTITSISAEEFARRMNAAELHVVDVRKEGEWGNGHVDGAEHACLSKLNESMTAFSKSEDNYIHCQGGYRSMIASSIMKARGYDNIIDVAGGYGAISKTGVKRVAGEVAK
ncbi:MAG: MBL fold metallo-hydrolase [Flavobacteriales bacterium]|nr:MBL fold metallo-hydrolase [Flavobacteriales bacterium]